MHNGLGGIPGGKIENTSGLPKTLIDKTTKFSESLEKIITDDFLTEEETKFFDELQNPDAMKENAKKIVGELCKRICDGENPSQKLFDNVCLKVIGIEGGMYPGYTQALLKKLPDWKNIAYLFQYNSNNSYNAVEEFRKKRKEYINSKLNPMHSSPYDPIREERPTNPEPKKEKIAAQYDPISKDEYLKSFSNLKLTEGETNVPLLKPEDIAFSTYKTLRENFSKNTKFSICDTREGYVVDKLLKSNEISNPITGIPYSFYDVKNDITHIMTISTERGINPGINIVIKGKVSQQDAVELVNYLKNEYCFDFEPINGRPRNKYDNTIKLKRTNIQETIMNFFNNK